LSSGGFATALGIAATLSLATVLAFVGAATTLAFATILALAIVLAHVAAWRVGAGRVGGIVSVAFSGHAARQQSGDGSGDEECSLCSTHNVFYFVWFIYKSPAA
jgi:hypothetical protein